MNKTKLSIAVLTLIAAGASAPQIAKQFLVEKEGMVCKGDVCPVYLDGSKIPTACMGHTGPGVKMGGTFTRAQCNKFADEDMREADGVVSRLVGVPMSDPQRAAVISFCAFNIGPRKCAESTFLRKLNAGDSEGACAEVRRWIRDRGLDCRERSNNCYGQVIRREQEEELCNL